MTRTTALTGLIYSAIFGIGTLLAACGGGGSSGAPTANMPQEPAAPAMTTTVGDAPEGIRFSAAGTHRGMSMSTGTMSEGIGTERLLAYLEVHASGGPWNAGPDFTWHGEPGLNPFREIPVIRMAEGSSPEYTAVVRDAVAAVNAHLPTAHQLLFGAPAPAGLPISEVPTGSIVFEMTSTSADWVIDGTYREGSEGLAVLRPRIQHTTVDGRSGYRYNEAAQVWHAADAPRHAWFSITLHELIHTLGFEGHVSQTDYPDTAMGDHTLLITTDLPALEGDAVNATYTRLPIGARTHELTPDNLGRWDDTRFYLQGAHATAGVEFGVSTRNGVADAWAAGHRPATSLADNAALSGNAVWNGAIIGFTPGDESVSGAAVINVDLATLDGDAEFQDLETWGVREAPGVPGTGMRWMDGDLAYTIDVTGNRFRRTGGDAGVLDGRFVGTAHEGAVGTLDRDDLTASFGAAR